MNYASNLPAVDAYATFKHMVLRPMPHAFGHLVPSDWHDKSHNDPVFGIWKRCGSWTLDEHAILAACARQFHGKAWCDIGCNTGMTSKTINWVTNASVACVDYMLALPEFRERFADNTGFPAGWIAAKKSDAYFRDINRQARFSGFVIDGDHDAPQPVVDAMNAVPHLEANGVILLHDGTGSPVQEAVRRLMQCCFKARAYFTPHLVFACWRGDFTPPDHVPDPVVKAAHLDGRYPDLDFGRMS